MCVCVCVCVCECECECVCEYVCVCVCTCPRIFYHNLHILICILLFETCICVSTYVCSTMYYAAGAGDSYPLLSSWHSLHCWSFFCSPRVSMYVHALLLKWYVWCPILVVKDNLACQTFQVRGWVEECNDCAITISRVL